MTDGKTPRGPLTIEPVLARLGTVTGHPGSDTGAWIANEVGDAKPNLVFVAKMPEINGDRQAGPALCPAGSAGADKND